MIWIDVDGVVADFIRYAEQLKGCEYPDECGYELGISMSEIRWLEIHPTPWAEELVRWLDQTFPKNCGYMTACVEPDRLTWMRWFQDKTSTSDWPLVFLADKARMVGARDILVDDYPHEVHNLVRVPCKWWTRVEGKNILEIIKGNILIISRLVL